MWSKILWGLLVISVCLFGYFLSTKMEKYETQVWSGSSVQARKNPYLAAQQFLESRDVKVISTTETLNFDDIDTGDIVFLSHVDSMLVSQSQIDKALSWINRGGYLLVGVSSEVEGHASILNEFDINPTKRDINIEEALVDEDGEPLIASERMREINRQIEEERIKETQEQQQNKELKGDVEDEADKPQVKIDENDDFTEQLLDLLNVDLDYEYYRVNLSDADEYIFLAVLDRITLWHEFLDVEEEYYDDYSEDENSEEYAQQDADDEAEADSSVSERVSADGKYKLSTWVSDEHGARLLQFKHGDGTFTAISSSEYWENDYIGLADHAYFLSYIVANESTFHLFYNVTAPPLSELVKRYFFELLMAALVLLILWLWRNGIRVQPVTNVVEGQRRSFAEHLGASAKFLVAKQQYQVLIEPLKEDIALQMRPFYPNFSQLNEQAQMALLVERTKLPEHTLQEWVRYSNKVDSQDELVAALKIGNAIRKTL